MTTLTTVNAIQRKKKFCFGISIAHLCGAELRCSRQYAESVSRQKTMWVTPTSFELTERLPRWLSRLESEGKFQVSLLQLPRSQHWAVTSHRVTALPYGCNHYHLSVSSTASVTWNKPMWVRRCIQQGTTPRQSNMYIDIKSQVFTGAAAFHPCITPEVI